jgi:hypothetical protein
MVKYQVALSFAGEQRDYVERVARSLHAKGVAVFYDRFEALTLWGKDGVEFFHQLFAADTAYVIMFISKEYVEKKWTRHERRSALSRAIAEEGEYVLPVRFDDTEVPGVPDTLQYLKASDYSPEALAVSLCTKIGVNWLAGKASDVPPPMSTALSGEVVFDYSSSGGRYIIGQGPLEFETRWSKSSDTNIILYNYPHNIHGIAVARRATQFSDIADASAYDFTSPTRRPKIGELALLRNSNGFYAALKIIDIKDDSREAPSDELRFQYAIQPNGSASFADFPNLTI